jgi:hypothetical protein
MTSSLLLRKQPTKSRKVPSVNALISETASSALENESSREHISPMEKYRSSMLEVSVTHQPPRWEWQITFDGEMIANGFECEKLAAQFEGNNAMFMLLASGWNP